MLTDRLRRICAAAVTAYEAGETWLLDDALAFAKENDGKRVNGVRKTLRIGSEGVRFLDEFRKGHDVSLSGILRGIVEVSVTMIPRNAWEHEN